MWTTMDRRGSESFFADQPQKCSHNYVLQSPDYSGNILNKLNDFRTDASFTDAILCVGEEEFPVHRIVLAVSSPYFMAMFTSDLRERHEAKVTFSDVSPWTVKRIIEYAYSGRLEITPDNAQALLAAGNLFEYPAIVKACCEFLGHQLHPSNCLGIENFAQLHCCRELQDLSYKFIMENFSAVVEFDEFLDLSQDRVIRFISSDLIDVRNEEIVYDAVTKWLQNDPDNRREYLYDVLKQVRLPVVDMTYLERIEQEPFIRSCGRSLQLVQEAQKHHESVLCNRDQRRRSMLTHPVRPRPSTVAKIVMVVVGGIHSHVTQSVEMYDSQKGKWTSLPDLPQPVSLCSVSAVQNTIIVCGGIVDGRIVSNVCKFDPLRRIWSELRPLLRPRARHASTVYKDKLYLFGGISYDGQMLDLDIIDCYDAITDTWCAVGQALVPRKQSRVVPYNNMLVEVGGLQGDARVNTIDSYVCGETEVHSSGEQYILPEPIQFSQIVFLNGIFFIIWEDSRKVITLNPVKRTFCCLPDMHYAHVHSGITVMNDKIYIAGGLVESRPTKIVECYDPVSNRWTLEKPMGHNRAFHGCVSIEM